MAQTLAPHFRKRDRLRVCALLLFVFVAGVFFPAEYVPTPEQRANASPFTPEWSNAPQAVVYGMPFGMYYEFSEETFCCGKTALMPSGVFLNLLLIVILIRLGMFVVAAMRALTSHATRTH